MPFLHTLYKLVERPPSKDNEVVPPIQRALQVHADVATFFDLTRRFTQPVFDRVFYQLKLDAFDDGYPAVQAALMPLLPPRKKHKIRAEFDLRETNRSLNRKKDKSDGYSFDLSLRLEGQFVKIGKFWYRLSTTERAAPTSTSGGTTLVINNNDPSPDLVFTCFSRESYEAIVQWCDNCLKTYYHKTVPPRLYTSSAWGSWKLSPINISRQVSSSFYDPVLFNRLVADLQLFLESKDIYDRINQPYHRSYIFSGPPGTGKTTMSKVLATMFGLDLYVISLRELEHDKALIDSIQEVSYGSIIVFEDIDAVFSATAGSRESVAPVIVEDSKQTKGVTLSGVLNAIDGLSTPPGVIFILTTNYPERIDPAFHRPGRSDLDDPPLYFDYIGSTQITEMFRFVYQTELSIDIPAFDPGTHEITAARVIECFKSSLHDPTAGTANLVSLLNDKGVHIPSSWHHPIRDLPSSPDVLSYSERRLEDKSES